MKARRGLSALPLLWMALFAGPAWPAEPQGTWQAPVAASSTAEASLASLRAELVQKRAEITQLFNRLHVMSASCAEGRDSSALAREQRELRAVIERELKEFVYLCRDYKSQADALMEGRLLVLMAGKESSGMVKALAEHSSLAAFSAELKNSLREYRDRYDIEVSAFQICDRGHRQVVAYKALSICIVVAIFAVLWLGARRRKLGPMPVAGSLVGGNYRIIRETARRNWGVVFEAEDAAHKRRVTIEMISEHLAEERGALAKFQEAARRASALKHDNLLQTYVLLEEGGRLFLVCEFYAGQSLNELLAHGRRLALAPARLLLKQAAGALDYVHSRGLLYGFLNPAMVLVSREGLVKLMDIAVAHGMRLAGKQAAAADSSSLSAYGAPELARGQATVESDLFSLAAIACELLSGRQADAARSAAMRPSLEAVFRRALHPDSRQRYHSGAELMAALDAVPDRPAA